MRNEGHVASDMDLLAIIRRIDANGDAMVTFNEWVEFLKLHGYTFRPPDIKVEVQEVPKYYPVYVPVPEIHERIVDRPYEKLVYVP